MACQHGSAPNWVQWGGHNLYNVRSSKFEQRKKCAEVEGCVDSNIIAEKFAHHFQKACILLQ